MTGSETKTIGWRVPKKVRFGIYGIALLFAAIMGWNQYQQQQAPDSNNPPRTLVNDSVEETVRYAADHGWYPCPGDCLKLATPGWHRQHLQGFADTDWWMSYPFGHDDEVEFFSQRHIGHLIKEMGDKPARDVGLCPICHGTGWVRKESKK